MFLSFDLPIYSSIQTETWDSWGDQDRRLSHSITAEAVESAIGEVCFQKDLRYDSWQKASFFLQLGISSWINLPSNCKLPHETIETEHCLNACYYPNGWIGWENPIGELRKHLRL